MFVLFCSINLKLQYLFLFEKVTCNLKHLVPVQVKKSIMFSITCFHEHSNLSYTGKPCFDAK